MATLFERASKITSQGQTTVPKDIRDVLHVAEGDELKYSLDENGRVILSRADAEIEDPIITRFLSFLATDMLEHPERISALPEGLLSRAAALTEGMEINLDEPIEGEVDL